MAYMGSGDSDGWRSGQRGARPNAFDPSVRPELFRGVLTRRVIAFFIDLFVLAVPVILTVIFIAVFGLVTLGLGWALFWLVSPASVIWALFYYGATIGGPHSATIGMRVMDLELRTWCAGLFCARRRACRLLLDFDLGAVAFRAADRRLQ